MRRNAIFLQKSQFGRSANVSTADSVVLQDFEDRDLVFSQASLQHPPAPGPSSGRIGCNFPKRKRRHTCNRATKTKGQPLDLQQHVDGIMVQLCNVSDAPGVRCYFKLATRSAWPEMRIAPGWDAMIANLKLYVVDTVQTYAYHTRLGQSRSAEQRDL